MRRLAMRAALGLAGAMALATAGCVLYTYPAPGVVYVADAPPVPQYEPVPVTPGPGYVWIGGYSVWEGHAWHWRGGYWTLPPRSGAVWVAPFSVRTDRGWEYHRGYWR